MNIPSLFQRGLPERAGSGPGSTRWLNRLSTFEKVIIANSVIIVLDTVAGWWITQRNPETYHYIIDTSFIALAVVLGLFVNFLLLRAAFAPLHSLLVTIRAVEGGDLEARVSLSETDADVRVLARAFNSMLDQLAHSRNEVAARVLRAEEDERRRLALELHDQTGQSLTALLLHIEAIGQRLAGETSEPAIQAREQAERLSVLAQQTLTEVQSLSRQLRPPILDDLGLGAALRWLAEDARARLGISVRVVIDSTDRLPSDIETALFRIAQESLTNAVRHGHATYAACLLRQTTQRVTLLVADDGKGFDGVELSSRKPGHYKTGRLGLAGMQARIRPLGGTLAVRSHPGHGCWIRASAPLLRLSSDETDRQRQREEG
jgi:two-component system, NarL family, sensor histidine kinase UhpB